MSSDSKNIDGLGDFAEDWRRRWIGAPIRSIRIGVIFEDGEESWTFLGRHVRTEDDADG